jgi:ribosomal-protein-alanine N-acetyltransferase
VKTKLKEEDIARIAEIEASLFKDKAWSLELIKSELERPENLVIVVKDDFLEVIGYIIVKILLDEAEILRFGVKKENQGKGIGKDLLIVALDELKRRGVKKVFLEVSADNIKAQRLYEKFEFKKVGERKNYYSPGKPAFIMCKMLEEESHVKGRD